MTFLILPKLKQNSDVRPSDEAGKWDAQAPKTFQDVASSLDYKSPGRVKSVSSVPTMWARPLSIEMALHNSGYPIRAELIEQWQGMLAALALAEIRGFPLLAQLLDLENLRDQKNSFARSLYELLPDPVNALYTLDGKNPWQDVYVFLWDGNPVGMTSPSTLVVPSEEGKWEGLPWWNRQESRLETPHRYLNISEKGLLWRWLENLRKELNNHKGQPEALDMMRGLLDEFRDSLGAYPQQNLSLSDDPQFFGVELNKGVLRGLNKPVKSQPKASCVRLIPSPDKPKVRDLLIIDPEIAKAWDEKSQNIWVYENKTLASLNIEDLKTGKILWNNVECLESKDLFLPKFTFIDLEDALPGAFLPNTNQLNFNGKKITPLIPLNPILLNYLTPEDLIKRIQITPINGSEGPLVRVVLDLPLSGLKNDDKQPQNYRIFKDYPIQEENALTEVPVLELWPNFRAENWKEYYAFYYDVENGEETFQVSFPEAQNPHLFQDRRGNYQIARLEEFPSFITCQNPARIPIGLILLKTPEKIQLTASWKVGVDFGTSFTNVYVNRKDIVEPLPLENLHLKVTEVQVDTRNPVLFEYFIPESFIPPEKPLPLSSVLTTRGKPLSIPNQDRQDRPIYDGRIYIPDRKRFEPQQNWMETDLKWKNLILNLLFLKHLALHITALAAKNGVREIQWSFSYPSAFSNGDKSRYAQSWQRLTEGLEAQTGIRQLCPAVSDLDSFRTESLAIAQYFADQEDYNLVASTCIDMGGGTSDISIWQDNQLVHQCSVLLAGRDLFSQFLELNPTFFSNRLEVDSQDWQGLKEGKFNAKLDVFLRLEGESWLKNKRHEVEDQEDFLGFLGLMALGFSGLYYYVGTLLGVLYNEGKYNRNEITPVYMGGNGSRLLHWLAIGGQFDKDSEVNQLFSWMLSKGSGFPDTEEITRLSQKPKDEVACGLVLERTKLTGLRKKDKDPLIAGENCEVNGTLIDWRDRLELDGNIQEFKVSEFEQLRNFLDEFNLALRELNIDGLKPMKNYSPGVGLEPSYSDKLWREIQKELTKVTLTIKGEADNIRVEPPFILGLKALLRVLGKEWAGK
ncbi:conserved hypothetical protein [Planktothrix serta PCC 8927]|uniref:Uncharacterized protein n=1 Tax=Planktothrix serta PCC 8927 TaxID=671068 RepID=A0A7Z9BI85_9CYAN|nr:hypothetical protein [Planktothrix serta]VXD10298.1 conserved hypothetical protein [Planktothrix serta PCC 8927]